MYKSSRFIEASSVLTIRFKRIWLLGSLWDAILTQYAHAHNGTCCYNHNHAHAGLDTRYRLRLHASLTDSWRIFFVLAGATCRSGIVSAAFQIFGHFLRHFLSCGYMYNKFCVEIRLLIASKLDQSLLTTLLLFPFILLSACEIYENHEK